MAHANPIEARLERSMQRYRSLTAGDLHDARILLWTALTRGAEALEADDADIPRLLHALAQSI